MTDVDGAGCSDGHNATHHRVAMRMDPQHVQMGHRVVTVVAGGRDLRVRHHPARRGVDGAVGQAGLKTSTAPRRRSHSAICCATPPAGRAQPTPLGTANPRRSPRRLAVDTTAIERPARLKWAVATVGASSSDGFTVWSGRRRRPLRPRRYRVPLIYRTPEGAWPST